MKLQDQRVRMFAILPSGFWEGSTYLHPSHQDLTCSFNKYLAPTARHYSRCLANISDQNRKQNKSPCSWGVILVVRQMMNKKLKDQGGQPSRVSKHAGLSVWHWEHSRWVGERGWEYPKILVTTELQQGKGVIDGCSKWTFINKETCELRFKGGKGANLVELQRKLFQSEEAGMSVC